MSEPAVEVTVTEPESAPMDDAPDVVVVDTGDSDGGGNDLDIGLRLGEISTRLDALETRLAETSVTAEIAESTAETALDVAIEAETEADEIVEAVEEAVDEETGDAEPEPDNTPERPHLVHRSFHDLFGRK